VDDTEVLLVKEPFVVPNNLNPLLTLTIIDDARPAFFFAMTAVLIFKMVTSSHNTNNVAVQHKEKIPKGHVYIPHLSVYKLPAILEEVLNYCR
jgi:hypothetical protein